MFSDITTAGTRLTPQAHSQTRVPAAGRPSYGAGLVPRDTDRPALEGPDGFLTLKTGSVGDNVVSVGDNVVSVGDNVVSAGDNVVSVGDNVVSAGDNV